MWGLSDTRSDDDQRVRAGRWQPCRSIYEKDALLAPLEPDMTAPPHAMAPGLAAEDYYRGTVTGHEPPAESPAEAEGGSVR